MKENISKKGYSELYFKQVNKDGSEMKNKKYFKSKKLNLIFLQISKMREKYFKK